MPRILTWWMRCLWGYNGRRDDFQRGIEMDASNCFSRPLRHSVPAKQHIFLPSLSADVSQPASAGFAGNGHVGSRMHGIELCAGSGFIPRPEAKHRVSDSPMHLSKTCGCGQAGQSLGYVRDCKDRSQGVLRQTVRKRVCRAAQHTHCFSRPKGV